MHVINVLFTSMVYTKTHAAHNYIMPGFLSEEIFCFCCVKLLCCCVSNHSLGEKV